MRRAGRVTRKNEKLATCPYALIPTVLYAG